MIIYPLDNQTTKPIILDFRTLTKPYPAHRHHFLEFSYVVSGEGTETINGKEHQMKPGTFTLLLPYQIHKIYTEPVNPLQIYNCNISLEALFGRNKISIELNNMLFEPGDELPSYIYLSNNKAQKMKELLQNMVKENDNDMVWRELSLMGKLVNVFVLFDRARRQSSKMENKNHKYYNDNNKLNKNIWNIIYYIHRNYHQDITLQQLSDKFSVSTAYLSTSFKKYLGENFLSFLNDIRVKHACALLASSEMQITDIALEVGFNSYGSFSRVFRQKKDMNATEYRRKQFGN